jgi:hypothetical protein
MPKDPIKTAEPVNNQGGYITWGGKNIPPNAIRRLAQNQNSYGFAQRAIGSRYSYSKDVDTNVNVRPSFGRDNYDYFREKERIPVKHRDIMMFCNVAYKGVGIIRNVIDLMGNFSSDGISLQHNNPKIQKFYRDWWAKINGPNVCERFTNYFYRLGTVPVRRMTAKLKPSDVEKIQQAFAADIEIEKKDPVVKREIPWKYTFLNPMTIESLTPEIGTFAGKPMYAVRLNDTLVKKINNPSNASERAAIANLPAEIINAARSGQKLLALEPDKNFFYFYKKDDWEDFGSPLISPLMEDILLLEKLRLADVAACDGVISQVRLWTVGSLDHKILPDDGAIQKISDMLTNHTGGGSMDLVWGPELSFKESTTTAHQFLGKEKYEPTLNSIYAGLGIPPTLTGAATAGGFTNNYISLKTLTENLEYGRKVLQGFIEQEVEFVRAAMGFKTAARIVFDRVSLSDDAAENNLLLQLVDRDIVSAETVLEKLKMLPDIELSRVNKEYKLRNTNKMPSKRGAYSSPEDDYMKLFIQTGVVTPSEAGLELDERKSGQKAPIDFTVQMNKDKLAAKPVAKPKGKSGSGRPAGKKDASKRKTKTVKPRTKASYTSLVNTWAKSAFNTVTDTILPMYLETVKKANARALTEAEFDNLEEIKFNILCSLPPLRNVNENTVLVALSQNMVASASVKKVYTNLVEKFKAAVRTEPTIEDYRNLRICAYSVSAMNQIKES